MAKFCFVIHPLSFDDVVRYEPGAKGKGRPIVAKILEWMPSYAAAHVTGVRTPDGRETEGWFVAAPLLPAQMLELPREDVYERILRAIDVGRDLGAQIAGLGAFTGVIGDGGVTIAARASMPVTTGNSLTIAAGIAQPLSRRGCDGHRRAVGDRGRGRSNRVDRLRVRAPHRPARRARRHGRAQRDPPARSCTRRSPPSCRARSSGRPI